jgi:hypothetical protein
MFWFEDYTILLNKNKLGEFFPTSNMNLNEKMNAIVRCAIYISGALILYSGNLNYIYIGLCALIATYIIYSRKKIENFENGQSIVYPTKDNPFMNVQMSDYTENPNRESANKVDNTLELRNNITQNFNNKLYRNVGDIFERENSQRQFYTNPITTIPNDQTKFAEWLYKTPPTCKEGNGYQCVANNHYALDRGSRNVILN